MGPTAIDLNTHVAEQLSALPLQEGGLVVAVSGGLDSCVLLDILIRVTGEWQLHVAHLNHQLRSDSGQDAVFVCQLAIDARLPCTIGLANVADHAARHGESVEMAARTCRRVFLRRTANRIGASLILLAHHADDQAETVLLRLLRGTSPTGLAAMAPVREGLLRPLLGVTRADLRQYALDHQLRWREDPTNQDIRIPRNRIRHQLMLRLQQSHNPQIVSAIGRTAGLLADEDAYLQQVTEQAMKRVVSERRAGRIKLECSRLAGYHIAVQRRVLRQILQELASTQGHWGERVGLVLDLLYEGAGPLRELGGGLRVQCTGELLIMRVFRAEPFAVPLSVPGRTPVPRQSADVECRWCEANEFDRLRPTLDLTEAVLDMGQFSGELIMRSPRSGDRLRPLGMDGRSKKLSDCFIDAGWPRILREDAVVVTERQQSDRIVWVPGLARSEHCRVDVGSEKLIHLQFTEQPMVSGPMDSGPMDSGDGER